jgi:hypothetical protein
VRALGIHDTARMPPIADSTNPIRNPPRFTPTIE